MLFVCVCVFEVLSMNQHLTIDLFMLSSGISLHFILAVEAVLQRNRTIPY